MTLPGFPDAAPIEGMIGGLFIGAAATLMLLANGRIAGISGITARAFSFAKSSLPVPFAWLFLAGLLLGGLAVDRLVSPIQSTFPPSLTVLAIGGLLVGFGTRLGHGCTSGHGVCGASRLSPRSLTAMATFMLSGMITVASVNKMGGGW